MSAAPQTVRPRAGAGAFRRALAATLALSWPLVLANLAVNAMTATDYMMLGWLSPRALAVGALGFNLYQPAFLLGIGLVAALSPIASAQLGAGGDAAESLRRASQQAFLSALAIAAVTWIALIETTPFLAAIGELPDLARDVGTYMRGFQWGLAPNLLFFAGRSVFAALERPRPTLVAGLAGVAFNAVANYALVFGKFGMPALGIIGSGLATTLAQTLMFAILVAASLVDPRMRRLRLFALPWLLARREFFALWRLGLPIGAAIVAARSGFSRPQPSSSACSAARRSKPIRSRCRLPRSPSWSRWGSARRRPLGSATLLARAIRLRFRGRVDRPSASPRSSPSFRRRR